MYNWDKDSDEYWDAVADAKYDREMEGYQEFCEENELDPEDENSLDSWKDAREYYKNPYRYFGLHQSDFL